tara:strand:- start:98 stop:424 length:327 start_codon:yes stop_codon:yes gene_type:complete
MRIQDHTLNNLFEVHFIIHEKQDNSVLLNGTFLINNKKYYTDIPLDFLKFSRLCEKLIGLDKSKSIWKRLFNNNDLVAEVSPKKHLNLSMLIKPEDLDINTNYKLKIA